MSPVHNYIAHATAICRNPPAHTFTRERKKNFTDPQQTDT